ncbi:hypothetical protein Hte_004969 [Hypoxylon texense]
MVYCKLIPKAVVLPSGCAIELDSIGLPATSRIYHQDVCQCAGRQDEMLLKHLDRWRTHGAELMQINPRCAAITIIRLIDKWDLGTTGWLAGLQDHVREWREELVRKAIPNNPLARAKVAKKKKKRNPKLRPAGLPSAAQLGRNMRWCEEEDEGEEYR